MRSLSILVVALCGSVAAQVQVSSSQQAPGRGLQGATPRPGAVSVLPSSVDFGAERMGVPGAPTTVTLTNASAAFKKITGVTPLGGGTEFAAASSFPIVIPPGGSVPLDLVFTPDERGPRTGTLRIDEQPAPLVPTKVPVIGVGYGPAGAEVFINAGGDAYTGADPWNADYGFVGGASVLQFALTQGTPDDFLFTKRRQGRSFSYALELPNGTYDVALHFSDYQTSVGERVFDVSVEDAVVVDDLDIVGLVGTKFAHTETIPVTLTDGQLDIDFQGEVGEAVVHAIEIRSVVQLDVTPLSLDMGIVDEGDSSSLDLTVSNTGFLPLTLDTIEFTNLVGDSAELSLVFDGNTYAGDVTDVTHTIDETLAGGQSLVVPVTFAPLEHATHNVEITFSGPQHSATVDVQAISGFSGDPYLHPVLLIDDPVVDYDDSGSEDVLLDGSDSHTHEPGKSIVAWEWTENGNFLSSQEVAVVDFPLGPHTVALEIFDDNVPSNSLSDTKSFTVVPVDAVPGTIIGAYNLATGGQTALDMLDAPPTNPDFAELLPGYQIAADATVGGSPFASDVFVQMLGSVDVTASESWDFSVSGGTDSRILWDGNPVTGSIVPTVGSHELEVRVAVDDASTDLPIALTVSKSGAPAVALSPAELSHDQQSIPPVINTMPTSGTTLGGNQIIITGFGFFPQSGVTVHWGGLDLTEADFVSWSAEQIELFSPPGAAGPISVTIETPNGTSNIASFTYQSDGPVPVQFLQTGTVSMTEPTAAAWGPDGRLYVVNRLGRINAITYDDDYGVVGVDTYPGVFGLSNPEAMGIAFDPYDPPSPIRVYVAHTEMYAQGGGSFSGPSPYPGQVSVLEGPDFDTPIPLITQLPTSNHDHGVNGMLFDNNGDLLFSVGGNTNAGVKFHMIGDLPESPLSAAICKAYTSRPNFNGALSYVEVDTGLPNNDQVYGESVQLVPGVHVDVQASGLRNCFDFALATNGHLYATDNGPNGGFGLASTSMTTQSFVHPSAPDEIVLIERGEYYGSANRARGLFDPREAIYFGPTDPPSWEYEQALDTMQSSVNGLTEYRAEAFGGQLRGDLLAQKFNGQIFRIELSLDGRSVTNITNLPTVTAGLGLNTGPGGALVLSDYSSNELSIWVPDDLAVSGMTPYDITPWRAPGGGGASFVIGGENFGTLGDTTVTFDSLPAMLTSVSPTRIRGIVPENVNDVTSLVNIGITTNGTTKTLDDAFQWMPDGPGQNPGTWSTGPDMPLPAGEVACGAIASRIYLVGEGNDKTYSYHVPTGTWVTGWAVRPFVGHHHGAEVWNGKWYLIGGLGSGAGKVQIYDPVLDSWSLGTDMPWAAGSVSTALIGDSIYVAGGIVGNQTVDNAARYDLQTDTWHTLASMPSQKGRNHAAAGTDGRKFYIFGGRGVGSGSGNVVANGFADVHVYDPQTDTWDSTNDVGSSLVPLPIGRGGTGKAVYFQKEFYVFGGETLNGPGAQPGNVYDRVDVYDPLSHTWRTETVMPTARHGIFPLLYQGKIYVAGGGVVAGFSASSKLEIFSKQ